MRIPFLLPLMAGMLALFLPLQAQETAPPKPRGGIFLFRWLERPSKSRAVQQADPQDRGRFAYAGSFDPEDGEETFGKIVADLREGDVIAYRMKRWESLKGVLKGQLNQVGYHILEYGHLAILVGEEGGGPRIFSSESFKGPNEDEGLTTLRTHRWDIFRLDQPERLDRTRLREFADLAMQKAGHWYGYDFVGMFGLWNTTLKPDQPKQVRRAYICSTVVVAALHYAKVETSAVNRKGMLDLVSPRQVVASHCRYLEEPPDVDLEAVPAEGPL
jgi:hypothetical protein